PPIPQGRAVWFASKRAASASSQVQWPGRPARAARWWVRVFIEPMPASQEPLYCGQRGGENRGHTPHPASSAAASPARKAEPLSDLSTSGAPCSRKRLASAAVAVGADSSKVGSHKS